VRTRYHDSSVINSVRLFSLEAPAFSILSAVAAVDGTRIQGKRFHPHAFQLLWRHSNAH